MIKILSKQELSDIRTITTLENLPIFSKKTAKIKADTYNSFVTMDFYKKDRTIICKIKDEYGKTIATGKASCMPNDRFELSLGLYIAENRAKSKLYKHIANETINEIYDK